nr:MAG TPA: hypothetical protein [Caudoviricetes sp.]
MEWCLVVKLPSATIPCFFLLLFIRRRRQGLNLRKNRLIAGLIETKNASSVTFENGFQIFVPFPPCFLFPPFCPPLSPTTPITPYNPPNIFRAPPFPPRVFSASAGVICASAHVDGAGCAMIVQK